MNKLIVRDTNGIVQGTMDSQGVFERPNINESMTLQDATGTWHEYVVVDVNHMYPYGHSNGANLVITVKLKGTVK